MASRGRPFFNYYLSATQCIWYSRGMSVRYQVIVWFDGTWRVWRSGAKRASSAHPTQSEAVEKARKLAKKNLTDATVVIHRVDGTVISATTYGKKSLHST